MENMEDGEARVFQFRDFQYDYAVDPDITFRYSYQYDALYKDLPKKQHTLKKAKYCEFCNSKSFPREEPTFCCRKEKVNIYILELPAGLR
ncbi:hypothetical protein PAHAL_1G298000 [Panicum hallii]|uniref:Uncharacterized protein n=1 Tax=Panicum hallii TaxID=206008 RepID=A0A2S3GQQ2_9POAL|nr:hypothetical protein PAHAL_1G298000 [Panicum hallii]